MHDLILALRGQIFEYLSETFDRHALGCLEPAHSEKKRFLPTKTPEHC